MTQIVERKGQVKVGLAAVSLHCPGRAGHPPSSAVTLVTQGEFKGEQ
jgi:hypothetical protein